MEQGPMIQTIDQALLDEVLRRARVSPRRRAIHCFHSGDWEHGHRMLNALTPGTYVRPHRHGDDHQREGFIILRGALALLIFDDNGQVDFGQSRMLSARDGCLGMDIAPRVWHSLVALEEAVIYEVKGHPAGGYVEARDKDFAPWSPEEGSSESDAYRVEMERWATAIAATPCKDRPPP